MTKVILTFNIGIELGQIAVIIAIFPLLYHWRKSSWYETVVLKGGSSVIGLIALYWFVARITG